MELAALLDLLERIAPYNTDEGREVMGLLVEQRARVSDLRWRIFRACGYSDKVVRNLIK